MRPTNTEMMFYAWGDYGLANSNGSLITRLTECGVVLDTSKTTTMSQMFAYTKLTEIPTLDFTALSKANTNIFRGSNALTKIEKIIVNQSTTFEFWFTGVTALKEIRSTARTDKTSNGFGEKVWLKTWYKTHPKDRWI